MPICKMCKGYYTTKDIPPYTCQECNKLVSRFDNRCLGCEFIVHEQDHQPIDLA